MSVVAPPTVAVGHGVLASGFSGQLQAADERLARLYSGGRSWYAFNTASVPAQQIPPTGAVYVLSADADRVLLPVPGAGGCPFLGSWPAQYNHAAHVAAAAAMTITGSDPSSIAWVVTGVYLVDVYHFGDAASVLERTHLGESRPLMISGAIEPERFHRYAIADVFIEAAAFAVFPWPHDKYGVVRFHNLSQVGVSVDLGGGITIALPPEVVRTVRRTARGPSWNLTARKYFPICVPSDIPLWDSDTSQMDNLPLKSQASNPIFRQAILPVMFQPVALTNNPGMFSATILPVMPPVASVNPISAAIIQSGKFDLIRTISTDVTTTQRISLTYSGEDFSFTPPAWTAEGLTVSLDDTTRGAILEPDPAFPPPGGGGAWHFDIISRSTNLTGGIVVAVRSGTVTERILLPWFKDPAAADGWYAALFVWPTYNVTRISDDMFCTDGVWTPTGSGDTDYYGSWSQSGPTVEVREWVAQWDGSTFGTVSAWNVFTKTIGSSMPPGGTLVRQPLLTAVMTYQDVDFFVAREDVTWDDATCIDVRPTFGARGIDVAGLPWGIGTEGDEPRWQYALFPTIGNDPRSLFSSYPFYGTEDIIWTPLVPSGVGTGNLYHWRTQEPRGAYAGAAWSWHYDATGHTPIGLEPSGAVQSGMSFWRMFSQSAWPPGSGTSYPKKVDTGPQPWAIRDHGWLADQILAGGPVAAGDAWPVARTDVWDNVIIGLSRPDEFNIGFQMRMCAAAFNQISALIAGMSHVRPLGWENYKRGFSFNDLVGFQGWNLVGLSDHITQPFEAVHIFGPNPTIDGKLLALGIGTRTYASPELQALQTITMQEYYQTTDFVTGTPTGVADRPSLRPGNWTSIGNTLTYCTADDIHDALALIGFAFNIVKLVQPISIATLIPGTGIETETDTFTSAGSTAGTWVTPVWARIRIDNTMAVPIPDTTGDPKLQLCAPVNYRIALERPMRAQIIIRATSPGGGLPTNYSVRRVHVTSGAIADSIDRLAGEFDPWNVGSAPHGFGAGSNFDSQRTWWNAMVLCRSGLSAKVLCIPWREVLSADRAADETGPLAMTDDEWSSNVVLPDDVARPKVLTVSSGSNISFGDLAAATAYPAKHHVWELLPFNTDVEVM